MRSIKYDGRNSFIDLGVRINSMRSSIGKPSPRYTGLKIPYRDGEINCSKLGGKIYYDPRALTYCFVLTGTGRTDIEDKQSGVLAWLSGKICELYDSDFPVWYFTNVMQIEEPTLEYLSENFRVAYLTVKMTADPYMVNMHDKSIRRL